MHSHASLSLLLLGIIIIVTMSEVYGKGAWERPGCHKVGHTRKISIPDCVEFKITTNACRGYCDSWAVPSIPNLVGQPITSVGECCNIMETEDVSVKVLCLDEMKTLTFKSATKCACFNCLKN